MFPIRGRLHAITPDRNQFAADAGGARLGEELLDDALRLDKPALAELVVTNATRGVNEVERGPVVVPESTPDRVIAVHGNRKADTQVVTARRTLTMSFSNSNSGECTPITTSPSSLYFSAQARTCGAVRSQLMQV